MRLLLLAAALLGVTLGAAACTRHETSPELLALRSDPMASYRPAGATLVNRSESSGGRTLGKPVRGSIVQRYQIDADADPRLVRDAAVTAAEQAGWAFFASGDIASATRTIAGSEMTLSVEVRSEGGTPYLNVVLLAEAGTPPATG